MMETIKTSKNVEFDVIYADGTRKRVPEGILFGVEDERIIFHNGTDRPEVMVAVAEAAAEVIGYMRLPESMLRTIAMNIFRNLHADGFAGVQIATSAAPPHNDKEEG